MDPLALLTRAPLPFLARCHVPEDLEAMTSVGHEEPLAGTGVEREAVESVWEAARAFYRTGITPALQLCIRRRGRIVLNRTLGHARGNAPDDPPDAEKVLATGDTPFNIYSASKLVTAMLIHKLDERGVLHLEDRVSDFIPEFAGHGKQWITLRHLLAHRAGIPNIPPEAMDLELLEDPEAICRLLCEMRPSTRPGRLLSYHAISSGFVLGEVVRRVSGVDIRQSLEKEILAPLGFRWMRYGVAPEDLDKVAVDALTGPPPPPPIRQLLVRALGKSLPELIDITNDPRFVTGIVPSGNVFTTAEELSAFLQCLLQEGELGGVRVFEPRTVHHALNEESYREIDLTLFVPLRYGLGPMLGDEPLGIFGPHTAKAFGHLGFSNVFPWADPEREIAVAFITSGKAVLSLHAIRLFQLIWRINDAFPKPGAA